jgi:hypothetical protein
MIESERSFERIERADLRHLADLACKDFRDLFDRKPELGKAYRNSLLAICLCQGAAEHYVRGKRGIKDFDVFAFFRQHSTKQFPYRRPGTGRADFGPSKFGRNPDNKGFEGRRVDIFGRAIASAPGEPPAEAIRRWLRQGTQGSTACYLAQRPVIAIEPPDMLGRIIWDSAP